MGKGHLQCLGGEREHFFRQGQAPAPRQCRIGQQGAGTGRAVHQRQHFLFAQLEALGHRVEQRCQAGDLASAALAGHGNLGQCAAGQQTGNGVCEVRADGAVAFDEIGQPGKDDPAGDTLRQGGPKAT